MMMRSAVNADTRSVIRELLRQEFRCILEGGIRQIAKALVENHEEAALFALIAVGITGLVSVAGLFLSRRAAKLPPWIAIAPLALALVTSGLLGWTANLGRQIRHTEIRRDFNPATPTEKTDARVKQKRPGEAKESHE